jgi:putative nucleotidyltransferase with HDIG domain
MTAPSKIRSSSELAARFPIGVSWHDILVAGSQLLCVLIAEITLGALLDERYWLPRTARVLTIFASIYIVHRFAQRALSGYGQRAKRDLTVIYGVFLLAVLCTGVGRVLSLGLCAYLEKHAGVDLPQDALFFSIPYAAGIVLVQAVLGVHVSLVIGLQLAILVAAYSPHQPVAFPFLIATFLVCILSFLRFRSRSAFLKVGMNITLIGLPFALGDLVIGGGFEWATVVAQILGCLVSGTATAFIAAGTTPLIEYLGGYATDMRMIEMATLDHPLLKELSIQAPGTWNHSMVMGMMVESAADSIGANSVICRVGAYFHDIGKVKKPLYFVENQIPGENRHDKLSPSMSSLIIRSHVKDGVELAKRHGVPDVIEDMITQHHGTSVIEYFYEKARVEAEANGQDPESVDISLYTYPGPKPQTKEAGILMLADGIEAAARTLSDPSHDRIQGMVQKLINKVFASGELDQCELTLKDLHAIAKCFTRVLTGIYHQRVAYAEPAEKGTSRSSADGTSDDESGDDQDEEDLRRLGIS